LKTVNERWVLEGPLYKVMLKIGLPIAAMQVLNVVYNIVDLYWLGRYSTHAIAAINSSWPTFFLIISAFTGLFGAGNALVSQSWGAGKYEYAVKTACQLISFSIISGIPLALFTMMASPYLLSFITSDPNVYSTAIQYISIIAMGLPLFGIFGSIQSAYVSIGKSIVILWFMVISNLLNMILDPLFIFGWFGLPEMGAAGAALATILSEGFASLLAFTYFITRGLDNHMASRRYFIPDLEIYKKVLRIGLPLSGSNFAEASGFYVLATIIGLMGTKALSAWGIGDRPFSIVSIIDAGLLAACTTIVGQSIGAREFNRAKETVRKVLLIIVSLTTLMIAPIVLLRSEIASVFSPLDHEVAYHASEFMLYMGPSLITLAILQVAGAVANGSGHTKPLMALSMLRLWVLRNLFAYLMGPGPIGLGVRGLWIGMSLSNIVTGLVALTWIISYRWLKPVID
jgi:putative efflux protein, MATE family